MPWLQPTYRHSQLPPRCTHNSSTLEMVPCSQYPKHQKVQSRGCWWVAWHLVNWCSHASDMNHTSGWSPSCLHTWLARKIHFARSLHECIMRHGVLHVVMSGIVLWSWCLLLLVHTSWVGHQSRLYRGMTHPICGDNFCRWASFCFPLVVHDLQP